MSEKIQSRSNFIRHYTDVDALFHILRGGLRFSKPKQTWDDKNDYFTLHKYEQLTQQHVFVLCFCNNIGNTHHWSYFGQNLPTLCSGCNKLIKCNIKFNRKKLQTALKARGLSLRPVVYCKSSEIKDKLNSIEILPVLKKWEYRVEQELRVVVIQEAADQPANFEVVNCIESINILLSGRSEHYRNIKEQILDELPTVKVNFSGVRNSPRWKSAINKQLKNNCLTQ